MKPIFSRFTVALWVALGFFISLLPAVEPIDLVPNDSELVVVLRNRSTDSATPKRIDVLQVVQQIPLLQQVGVDAIDLQNLLKNLNGILATLEVTPQQLQQEIIGEQLLFYYREKSNVRAEEGAVVVQLRDTARFTTLLEKINQLQVEGGELGKVVSYKTDTGTIFERTKPAGVEDTSEFYILKDKIFAISPNKESLETLLAQLSGRKKAEPFWRQQLEAHQLQQHPVLAMVNPRALDATLQNDLQQAGAGEKAFLSEFSKYWQKTESIGLGLTVGENRLDLQLSFRLQPLNLPTAERTALELLATPSDLWQIIPNDAMFAYSAHTDCAALSTIFSRFLLPADQQEIVSELSNVLHPFLEEHPLSDVVGGISGPNALWVALPTAKKQWVPNVTLAVKTKAGDSGEPARRTFQRSMDFTSRLVALQWKGFRVRTDQLGTVKRTTVRYDKHFPTGLAPSFAVKDDYLLLTSQPDLIADFTAPTPQVGKETGTTLMRISFRSCRTYLQQHSGEISMYMQREFPGSITKAELATMEQALTGLDQMELKLRPTKDGFRFNLQLQLTPK
ncbi:MAG: hypothetical protein R3B84_10140 [Zavarzinella sp.]